MFRFAILALLVASSAHAQTRIGASADIGYTRVNLAGGLGPSAGVQIYHDVGGGTLVAALRFETLFVDRAEIASDYTLVRVPSTYFELPVTAATCSDADGEVDLYLCDAYEERGGAFGAYSAEIAYAPVLPVAVGVGVRFGEEIDRERGKRFGVTRPYATLVGTLPATPSFGLQARARLGAGLVEVRLGVAAMF